SRLTNLTLPIFYASDSTESMFSKEFPAVSCRIPGDGSAPEPFPGRAPAAETVHEGFQGVPDDTPVDGTQLFSLRENTIAKEPGSSYPERWRCVSRLWLVNGGLDSLESSRM